VALDATLVQADKAGRHYSWFTLSPGSRYSFCEGAAKFFWKRRNFQELSS